MDDHRVVVGKQLVQFLTALCRLLDNLDVHVVGRLQRGAYGRLSSSHDDDVLYVGIVLLANNLTDIGDILLRGHEVGQVVKLEGV